MPLMRRSSTGPPLPALGFLAGGGLLAAECLVETKSTAASAASGHTRVDAHKQVHAAVALDMAAAPGQFGRSGWFVIVICRLRPTAKLAR
jgi:hypothetical protein